MWKQIFEKVEFFAHLYTGNPNTHRSNDLQMVQDEFLQFGDAAALNEKQSVSLCCISWCGSVARASLQTNVMYTVHIRELFFLCFSYATVSLLTYWDMAEILIEPLVVKNQPHRCPQHPSSSHLHLVDVGWMVPAAAKLSGSLTAAVRYHSAFSVSGANPDTVSPVGWIVAATALELTGDRENDS